MRQTVNARLLSSLRFCCVHMLPMRGAVWNGPETLREPWNQPNSALNNAKLFFIYVLYNKHHSCGDAPFKARRRDRGANPLGGLAGIKSRKIKQAK